MNSEMRIPKKLAMINDLTGYGRCSLAVAIPIVSAMKVQACPAPTSLFSNHMAFPTYYTEDFTKELPNYLEAWDKLSLTFDGIFCGFLGSKTHVDNLCSFLDSQKIYSNPIVLIDPVMGDHGKLYSSVTPKYVEAIKTLSKKADILTPNLTEACLLTNISYPTDFPTEDVAPGSLSYSKLSSIAERLHALGPQKVVITGLSYQDSFYNFVSEKNEHGLKMDVVSAKAGGPSRPGTGDIFASILAADSLNDVPFLASVKKAAEFIRICTEGSAALEIPIKEGVCFENYLHLLYSNLSTKLPAADVIS